MSKATLKIAPGLELPLDAVSQTFAILAMRGAGKSNTAVVMAEEMYANKLPFVVIDPIGNWWGLRVDGGGRGPGLDVPIFGAVGEARPLHKPEPDLPLEKTGGRFIADLVVNNRLSCVLDVSAFSEGEKTRFLIEFGTRLWQKNEDSLHLFLEEADDYIPQKPFREQAQLVHVFSKLVKQGRAKGLGMTMITQRAAVISKNVLTQTGTLMAMRNTSPQDRAAIQAWVDYHGQSREIIESLPTLKDGEGWIWSPQWLGIAERVQFRRRWTFDSASTPKAGKAEVRKHATLSALDLESLRLKMAATIEEAEASDPKLLRKKIADLESQLSKLAKTKQHPAPRPPKESKCRHCAKRISSGSRTS